MGHRPQTAALWTLNLMVRASLAALEGAAEDDEQDLRAGAQRADITGAVAHRRVREQVAQQPSVPDLCHRSSW